MWLLELFLAKVLLKKNSMVISHPMKGNIWGLISLVVVTFMLVNSVVLSALDFLAAGLQLHSV